MTSQSVVDSALRYVVGLDLGQMSDPTALVVLERTVPLKVIEEWVRDPGSATRRLHRDYEHLPATYECRHIDRLPLGTSYPDVVEQVRTLLAKPPLTEHTRLVVDKTGVGVAVTDMLRQAGLKPRTITIHGGDAVTSEGSGWRVPKRDLVACVSVLLQTDRVKIGRTLRHADTLIKELLNFKVKIDPVTAHDSYAAWREGDHDDLVLALACAAWFGERFVEPEPDGPTAYSYYSVGW